jgi:hypothetical protein
MTDKTPEPKHLMLDLDAPSASPSQPAFLSRPPGSRVYHGFPIVPETCIDGWCYGTITEFADAAGCTEGDGFVQAPDGSRAGLVWEVGSHEIVEICAADSERWGVYGVCFPRPVHNVDELRECFGAILPKLRAKFEELKHTEPPNPPLQPTAEKRGG